MPMDSTGNEVFVGDVVRYRGREYTIAGFGTRTGRYDTWRIEFTEPVHTPNERPDEISIDFVRKRDACEPVQ